MITIKATGDTTLHTAGKYCAEDILVKVPEGSGGRDLQIEADILQNTLSGHYRNELVQCISQLYMFEGNSTLESLSFPNCISLRDGLCGFNNSLTYLYIPKVQHMANCFNSCPLLEGVHLIECTQIDSFYFNELTGYRNFNGDCPNFHFVDIPNVTHLEFQWVSPSEAADQSINVFLLGNQFCSLVTLNNIESINHVFVPAALESQYKSATNWSAIADRIHGVAPEKIHGEYGEGKIIVATWHDYSGWGINYVNRGATSFSISNFPMVNFGDNPDNIITGALTDGCVYHILNSAGSN